MTNTTYEPISDDLSDAATKGDLQILGAGINERLNDLPTKEDFSQLLTSVDRLAGQVATYNTERAAEGERIRRIEKWIEKAAEKINVPLEF